MWPDGTLEKVLEHYDVQLKTTDNWQKISCPVHEDRHPSCSVSLGSNFFECHACGKSGGPVDVIMERENIGREAATSFCEGITGTSNANLSGRNRGVASGRVRSGTGFRPGYRGGATGVRGGGHSWV